MEANREYVPYLVTSERSISQPLGQIEQVGQHNSQDWAGQQQWSAGGNSTTNSFTSGYSTSNDSGFTSGSLLSSDDLATFDFDNNGNDNVFYSGVTAGAYEYSPNFVDMAALIETPAPILAPVPVASALAPVSMKATGVTAKVQAPSAPIVATPVQTPVVANKQSKKNDPEYQEKRKKNNEAARASRIKKKKNYEEMVTKCQRKKEKIALLRLQLTNEIKEKEKAIRERDILQATIDMMQKKMNEYESNDVQVIAVPSGQGFGIERSQDFTEIPAMMPVKTTRRWCPKK